ncbi:hypothetical protein GW17_00050900 [Ensete ventricosum]|nr:hypothetical protein GW17_00050900 [Ensete ventricosum]
MLIERKTSLDSIAEGRRHFGWNWACMDDSHNGDASTITWQWEDKVEGDGDEDARRTKNHQEIITCLASYWSIPPYAELEALELIVNVGEATCIRCPSRQ